jgi:hypothetical protein
MYNKNDFIILIHKNRFNPILWINWNIYKSIYVTNNNIFNNIYKYHKYMHTCVLFIFSNIIEYIDIIAIHVYFLYILNILLNYIK